MEYLHYFETIAAFNTARDNNYLEPWTSYTEEGDGVAYNITEEERERILLSTPFTVEALGSGNITWGLGNKTVQYSKNGGSWETMDSETTISVVAGDKVQLKGTNTNYNGNTISATTQFNVKGNIMSLTNGDEFGSADTVNGNSFKSLFSECTYLISAGDLKLPATTLADACYGLMFKGCTSLTTAPELPATTLEDYCYSNMFQGCTSLITAPELQATTLSSSCYASMFKGCTSLTTAPELPAMTLSSSCYETMFEGCTNLTTAPELPATILADYCYQSMFSGCTSLTTAPELSVTTLMNRCYYNMFEGCTNLTTAPSVLPATTLTSSCYGNMFKDCTSLITAPALPATTLAKSCYDTMFKGCSSLTTAPELPATTLARFCYYDMFSGCSRLNYIKCLATDISAYSCTTGWVTGVASSGTFVKNPNMSGWTTGSDGIPTEWTVETTTA